MILQVLAVALGSALGGVARYSVGLVTNPAGRFPLATLLVNGIGSTLIGVLAGLLPPESVRLRLFLMTGFCGGFTTFSAFALESNELAGSGDYLRLGISIFGNLVVAIAGCRFGLFLSDG